MNSSSWWQLALNNTNETSTVLQPVESFENRCEAQYIVIWLYPVTAMNHLLCMGSVIMSTLIVYTYCTSTKSIINKVRCSSIAATTFWTLSNIAWNINWHHDAFLCANYYNLTFSEDSVVSSQVFRYSRQIAFLTQAMGYFFFALSFLYRLIHSFKDSFFEISNCCKNSAIFGLFTVVCMFVVLLILNTIWFRQIQLDTIWLIFLSIGMIIYIIASIIALRVMITKLFRFKLFIQGRKQRKNFT